MNGEKNLHRTNEGSPTSTSLDMPVARTRDDKLDQVYHAVFGERIGETKEPGLIIRIRRVEAAVRYVLAGGAFLILHALGVPTDKIIDVLKALFGALHL